MRGPFVPGGLTTQPPTDPTETPDASTRRARFQNRGQDVVGSTLFLGNDSALAQPTPAHIPTPDGVGDGNQPHAGNAFESPATPSYELGQNGVVPSVLFGGDAQETPTSTPRLAAAPPQPSSGATPAKDDSTDTKEPLYSGGVYWKFLGPSQFGIYIYYKRYMYDSFTIACFKTPSTTWPPVIIRSHRLRRYFKPQSGKSAASKEALEMFNNKAKRYLH